MYIIKKQIYSWQQYWNTNIHVDVICYKEMPIPAEVLVILWSLVIIGPMTCELFVSILIYRSDLQNLFSFKLHYESSIKSNVWSKFIDVKKQIIFFLCHKSLTTNRKWLILMHWIHGRSRLSWQILLLIRFLTDYGNISGWLVS